MLNDRIEILASKYMKGTASPAELEELHLWYNTHNDDEELIVITEENETSEDKKNKIFHNIKARIAQQEQGTAKQLPLFRRTAFKIAASVFFILGITAIFMYLAQNDSNNLQIAVGGITDETNKTTQQKVLLTLANGSVIALDSIGDGLVSTQGGTEILKGVDGLVYKSGGSQDGESLYNSITIPKGQLFSMILPDGSKVWLNSSSSLQFPVAFNGKERKVKLTGEGYFEIAKKTSQPFKVEVNGQCEVEVLGTHFNVNAYDNEPFVNTSLLEGKLRVTPIKNNLLVTTEGKVIMPGQQVQMSKNGETIINNSINESLVLAWKKNLFRFEEATIEEIMSRAQQWYQIENIEYKGAIEDRFYSTISRDVSLERFLENLEKTGKVHFTLNGNTIVVSP